MTGVGENFIIKIEWRYLPSWGSTVEYSAAGSDENVSFPAFHSAIALNESLLSDWVHGCPPLTLKAFKQPVTWSFPWLQQQSLVFFTSLRSRVILSVSSILVNVLNIPPESHQVLLIAINWLYRIQIFLCYFRTFCSTLPNWGQRWPFSVSNLWIIL